MKISSVKMVLGILSIIFGVIFWPLGIVFGIFGLIINNKKEQLKKTANSLNLIGMIMGIIMGIGFGLLYAGVI